MSSRAKFPLLIVCLSVCAHAQSQPPNLFNALSWSAVFNQPVFNGSGNSIGVLNKAVPNVFAFGANGITSALSTAPLSVTSTFKVDTSIVNVNNAVNSSIATALGLIPLASSASGVIYQTDPATGLELPATSTLGTVFTERAETIGKHKWYFGATHQDYHFTSLNGESLNGLQVLYAGGTPSGIQGGSGFITSYPATFNLGMDVKLSQDVAFITYGLTDRLDVSVGLPVVHAAVAAHTYNGIIYEGNGVGTLSSTNPNCWCAATFNPGAFYSPAKNFTLPDVGAASLGKTGFGDMLVRGKGTVVSNQHMALAVGGDIRFATGDAQNYLGTGTTSFKPFVAVSLYTAPMHGIVFAPHVNVGWQFSGKSVLGGQLQPNNLTATMNDNVSTVTYLGAPLTASKGYLPDVLSWALGSEVAVGHRNTFIFDILSNEVGLIHGAPNLVESSAPGFLPTGTFASVNATGLIGMGATSYSQYSGAFGYKARLVGNLVLTVNALVRFDNNGLTARFSPLYGLGYTF